MVIKIETPDAKCTITAWEDYPALLCEKYFSNALIAAIHF